MFKKTFTTALLKLCVFKIIILFIWTNNLLAFIIYNIMSNLSYGHKLKELNGSWIVVVEVTRNCTKNKQLQTRFTTVERINNYAHINIPVPYRLRYTPSKVNHVNNLSSTFALEWYLSGNFLRRLRLTSSRVLNTVRRSTPATVERSVQQENSLRCFKFSFRIISLFIWRTYFWKC